MAGRTRNTKKLAQRIDLNYFKTLRGIPRWRRILSAVFALAGVGWLAWHAFAGSPTPYNAGPVAHAHALFGQKCGACHISTAGFQQSATDQACVACHDGPIHHAEQTFSPSCSTCHVEHKGAVRLANTSDEACTQCHANLSANDKNSPPRFASDIRAFDRTHPEFAVLRTGAKDPGTIKFNHQVHLDPQKPIRGPNGPVQLQCVDCHRPAGLGRPWPYASADAKVVPASFTTGDRAYMQPISYEKHCAACHPLQFDRRFSEPAPHKEPKVVHDFVLQKLTAYIAANPSQIPLVDEPDKRLPTRPPQRPARNAQEWVQQRMADAEYLLWRKACKECHTPQYPSGGDGLPEIPKAAVPARWLMHSNFDHEAHQMVACTSCHSKTLESKETSDVLIPGVQNCQSCHRSGANAAEARCFECHTYHDWSKETPAKGAYTLRQLTE
ncbi:MAG TPA: hypothetical protein VKX49_14090 [Bryobacteraceae bacterium]|nr:hypothetical protein [Bryobacteraceae bacterium]